MIKVSGTDLNNIDRVINFVNEYNKSLSCVQ